MKPIRATAILLCLLLTCAGASGSDHDETVPYYRSGAFNAPILEGWANQSGADFAQFELAEAQAVIRTALVTAPDGLAAAQGALRDLLGRDIGQPVYDDKVNLADGTWRVFVFDIDEATTASTMTRRMDNASVVISFVERDPESRTLLLTMAQADETMDAAEPELAHAAEALVGTDLAGLGEPDVLELASGTWRVYRQPELTAMGTVFGNDSYLALQAGPPGDLATLADAWNRTLLGFFVTPDNSGYLALGLAVVFVILGGLIFSFGWRARNLQQDAALIQQLAQADD